MPGWLHALLTYLLVGILAGTIAYLGNRLGRKIGRRKMTLLGMRPRHTSNFITALTGVLIAWATLSVATLTSELVRGAVVGMDSLRQEEARLRMEIAKLGETVQRGQVVFSAGEAILAGTLNPALGREGMLQQIQAALVAANIEAVNKNNDMARLKGLKPLPPETTLLDEDTRSVTDLLHQLSEETGVVGLKVVAAQNGYFQAPVSVRLVSMPVDRVFQEGDVIVQQPVQPGGKQFLLLWYDFLDQLRETARGKGMVEINNSLRGGMTAQDLERVSEEISRLKVPGNLVAIARRDLYQTSPLDVKIEVRAAARPVGLRP